MPIEATALFSFIVFYEIARFLTGKLQGILRPLSAETKARYADLSGRLSEDRVRHLGFSLVDKPYVELLDELVPYRNAVVHAIIEPGVRPFSVVAEDRIAFYRDVLRIMTVDLLEKMMRNVLYFAQAGISPGTLHEYVQARVTPKTER